MSQGFATTDTFPPITDVTATSPLSSSGGTTPDISHDNSGVTPGSYTNATVTVDVTGHVTSASSGTAPVTSIGVSSPITTTGGTTPTIGHATTGSAGTYGSATQVAQITTDATGHVSGVTQVTISGVAPGGSAGGDLSGTYPNPTVAKVNGTALGTTAATAGTLLAGNGTSIASLTMGGDATIGGTGTLTLATVNSNVGSFGSATQVGTFTVDAKGRLTAAGNTTITGVTPGGAAGGDLNGTYPNPTVDGLQGTAVSAVAPVYGQALLYNGSAWTPGQVSSGGGGGGTILYFNENTAAQAPTTNIPLSANGLVSVKQLGQIADVPQTTITSSNLSQVSYSLIAGFVTDVGYPDITLLPAGLFEVNIWAQGNANQSNQTIMQASVYKYDGSTAPTLIANSDDVYMYDPTVLAQYSISITIPAGTTLLSTDRLYIGLFAKATQNTRTVTFKFGDATPSHVHTTIVDKVNLATGVTGTLPITNGGTGATTFANHGVVVANTTALTSTAAMTDGQLLVGQTSADPLPKTVSGDATLANTGALTLASVNSNVGSFTNASVTVNAKGLVTAASSGTAPVTSVSASSPLSSSGGTTPTISLGTVGVGNGGTGVTALTAYGALVSNSAGTAVSTVAPGTNGNVLTSDGTQWTSGPAPVTGLTQPQVMTRISFGGF